MKTKLIVLLTVVLAFSFGMIAGCQKAADKAVEMKEKTIDKAHEVKDKVNQKADETKKQADEGMQKAGDKIGVTPKKDAEK
jgi:ElaB/YqjD/DUF883 family membrane-anchored ribosome-binding protein